MKRERPETRGFLHKSGEPGAEPPCFLSWEKSLCFPERACGGLVVILLICNTQAFHLVKVASSRDRFNDPNISLTTPYLWPKGKINQCFSDPHTDEGAEVKEGKMTCLRLLSRCGVEPNLQPAHSEPQTRFPSSPPALWSALLFGRL